MAYEITDWKVLDWEPESFTEIHQQVNQGMQVLRTGANMISAVAVDIENELTLIIAREWHKWSEDDVRGGWGQVDPGDIRGTVGNLANAREARAIARRIVRPLYFAEEQQAEAAKMLTRFPGLFAKHMAPLTAPDRPAPRRAGRVNYREGQGY